MDSHHTEGVHMETANMVWAVIATALVLFMTPGLAFFYGGLVKAKSVISMMMMSIGSIGLIGVLWILFGDSMTKVAHPSDFAGNPFRDFALVNADMYKSEASGNAWELRYFGRIGLNPSGDEDGDGLSNLAEFQGGSDPADFFNGSSIAASAVVFSRCCRVRSVKSVFDFSSA